ncbi:hypothetical protein WJX79_000061 [Trebouxia sp. C0005]
MSLNNGGVYTYGAPLVVHAFDQAKNSAACTHMQQQMDLSRVSSASMQLPVHSFVNGMDLDDYEALAIKRMSSSAQAAGVGLVCPPLAAVSLGASVLNACMTGYTIYQLHGISSHLGKMDGKLDSVVTSSARMEASLVNLTGSAQHITTLLDAVGTVGREGKEGTKKILDAMHIQRMQSLQEKMDLFQNCMKDHLRKPGDAHKAAALRARSFELQASAKSWAAELADDTNPVHIVGRQSFLMMHCLAAVGLDAASSAQECFQQDVREHRLEALQRVDADILVLLRSTTPYLIATVYQVALAQLVYLRRAMMSTTDIAQVYSCVSDSSRPQSTAVVHSANDLLWLDGLHGIRQLFQRSAADDAAEHQPLGSFFALIKVLKKVVEALHKGQFFMDAKMLGMEGNSDCQGVECLLIVSAMLSQEVQATTDSSWFWKQLSDTNQEDAKRAQCMLAGATSLDGHSVSESIAFM